WEITVKSHQFPKFTVLYGDRQHQHINTSTHQHINSLTHQHMKIRDVVAYLSSVAPPAYQESYDNAGLITGDPGWEVRGALVTLDCTEAVVDEAIEAGANLIVAHHPILFRGIKRL